MQLDHLFSIYVVNECGILVDLYYLVLKKHEINQLYVSQFVGVWCLRIFDSCLVSVYLARATDICVTIGWRVKPNNTETSLFML